MKISEAQVEAALHAFSIGIAEWAGFSPEDMEAKWLEGKAKPEYQYGLSAMRKALEAAAALSSPIEGEWQPIETAPDDHFPILAWSTRYGRVVAFRDVASQWWPCPAHEPLPCAPTKWRPLPASPFGAGRTTIKEEQP